MSAQQELIDRLRQHAASAPVISRQSIDMGAAANLLASLSAELAALKDEVERLRGAIFWACGANGDFPGSGNPARGKFFWRTELRERAGISGEEMNARAAPGGGG